MIRFRSLLSGAFICAASTTSLWAQVPVVQPSATVPAEIPVISARTASSGQMPRPTGSGETSVQTPQAFLQGLDAKLGQDSASLRLLPPIVKPGEQAPSAPAPARQAKVPIVSPKQAGPTKTAQEKATGPASFAPHFKADHPDLSLPTGVPIVQEAQLPKSTPDEQPAEIQSEPVKVVAKAPAAPPQPANQTASAGVPKQEAAESPIVSIPIVKSAALVRTAEAAPASSPEPVKPTAPATIPEQEVTESPIVSIPIVKSAALARSVEASPASPESTNPKATQDGVVIPNSGAGAPISRPEIALPPIKPGEEFPRMQIEQPAVTRPSQPAAQVTAPSNPVKSPRFEAVPVGTGAPESMPNQTGEGVSQTVEGVVLPAQPLIGPDIQFEAPQLPATADQMMIGPDQHLHDHSHPEHTHGPVGNSYLEGDIGSGCETCGGAGCSHCGHGGWSGLGNRELLQVGGGCDGGCFGLMPCAQNYFIGDVLYWTRNGGDVVGTDFGGVYDYDWNFGTQITMGTRTDPLYGHEIVYFGLFELNAGHTDFSPTGEIDARFNPTGGLGYGQTYAFFDGEEVTQTASSRLHSFQLNRTRLGWDVVQSHLGLRYIWFEDEYQLQSRNVFGESGRLSLDARNQLIGPEVGVKLFYDVGRRISFSSHWKLGGYLNAYRTSTFLENDGVTQVSNSDSGTGFSASFDLGVNAHVHLTQRMRLRGGYGVFWLWDVASVSDNFPYTLTPSSGTSTNDSESAIFHGANVGFEFYW